ncbi:MAG: uL15 family ribosomal protein [Candidatus Paceibacterota bacterium]|jgi:large subunit ribosomal protein L15
MQIHQIKTIHKEKEPKRVGRGGKRGTYCGRGGKGQTARAGHKMQPVIRELIKRYPKLRGYRFGTGKKEDFVVVNLDVLEKNFDQKSIVSPEKLLEKGLVRKLFNRVPGVKILGKAELTKVLIVENCFVSKGAKELIEKAGGQVVESKGQKAKTAKAQVKTARNVQRLEKKAKAQEKVKAKEASAKASQAKAKADKDAKSAKQKATKAAPAAAKNKK